MSLAPCPSCSRHVRRIERACPFCSAHLSLAEPPPRRPIERLGRAAIFTFGAAIATTASACAGTPMNLYGGPPIDTGIADDAASADDAGTDAAVVAHYGAPSIDAGVDMGGTSSDYGAPPPRDAGNADT